VWIGVIVIAVTAVMAAVLFAPITIDVSVVKERESAASAAVRFRWLGLSFRGRGRGVRRKARRQPPPARPRRQSRYGWPSVRAALGSPGFLRRCVGLLVAVGRLAIPNRLRLRGRIGFEDPAETGMFLGWLYASSTTAWTRRDWIVRIEPEFSGPVLEGRADLRWSSNLGSVLWPLITFLVSPTVWRAGIRARRVARFISA
jgi:hypothetical protein